VLVVEQNFAEFPGEIARDYFGKRHEPGLRVGRGEAATVGLMKIEAIEFTM
jgi:hypothetical protein